MPVAERQLNINLPESITDELQDIATHSNVSMPTLIQMALAVVKIASDASKNNQKLVVVDQNGKAIKEIVMPRR
jgi:hypothetical protein